MLSKFFFLKKLSKYKDYLRDMKACKSDHETNIELSSQLETPIFLQPQINPN